MADIEITHDGAAAWLVLNRPAKRNALNRAMWRQLPKALEEVRVKVLVVSGAGEHFAAGADISEFEEVYATPQRAEAYFGEVAAAMTALADFGRPTLARIDGACVGGGLGLALCCDLRVASDRARFGITPGKLGLVYSLEDTRRLVEAVGISRAKDILYTGRILEAEEALAVGLVDALCPHDRLDQWVGDKVAAIAAASAWSAERTKATIRRISRGQTQDDAETRRWMVEAVELPDFREGRAAFLEKRAARFPTP